MWYDLKVRYLRHSSYITKFVRMVTSYSSWYPLRHTRIDRTVVVLD